MIVKKGNCLEYLSNGSILFNNEYDEHKTTSPDYICIIVNSYSYFISFFSGSISTYSIKEATQIFAEEYILIPETDKELQKVQRALLSLPINYKNSHNDLKKLIMSIKITEDN